MCKVLKLEITETQAELQELLRQQKTGFGKERVQALYLGANIAKLSPGASSIETQFVVYKNIAKTLILS